MPVRMFGLLSLAFCSTLLWAQSTQQPSLQQAYASNFLIGAALNSPQILEKNPVEAALIRKEFNAYTPENAMKSVNIHPAWDRYNFAMADSLVSLGLRQKKQVNGHTLIWHNQLSAFAQQIKDIDSFKTFFRDHITTIAQRYDGKIHSWDVVNEALEEDGSMRKSIFLEKLGPDYVTEAFRLAAKATPQSELYYNDYNIEQPAKRQGCIRLIKSIQDAGVKIDGVGIQGHWHLGRVPLKAIEESILAFHALGLKVMITELDIEVLPRNFTGADPSKRMTADASTNPYTQGLPPEQLSQQAADYAALFKLLLKHRDKVTRVTFWGVHDGQSWLNNWPIRGRTNHPLLFDRSLAPKPAYQEIIDLRP
jgi:endo-1,4-beta-xylanase